MVSAQAGTDSVKVSYIYCGFVDIETNHAGVSLALVLQSVTTVDTVCTTYSIGELYKRSIANWFRSDLDTQDVSPQKPIAVLNSMLADAGSNLTITTDSIPDQIFTALESIKSYLDGGRHRRRYVQHFDAATECADF